MKNPSNILWLESMPGFFWTTLVGGYRYGRNSAARKPRSYQTDAFQAVFDSGTSMIYLPASISASFINVLLKGKKA